MLWEYGLYVRKKDGRVINRTFKWIKSGPEIRTTALTKMECVQRLNMLYKGARMFRIWWGENENIVFEFVWIVEHLISLDILKCSLNIECHFWVCLNIWKFSFNIENQRFEYFRNIGLDSEWETGAISIDWWENAIGQYVSNNYRRLLV